MVIMNVGGKTWLPCWKENCIRCGEQLTPVISVLRSKAEGMLLRLDQSGLDSGVLSQYQNKN